jgi:catechol 2,3-dioxygenase-like lactoylglutathione lyase family enzyme
MDIEKIDHVAIRVRDRGQACKLFTDLFGMEFFEFESEELDIKGAIAPPGIEFIEPLTPEGITAKILERHGEGLTLLSLKVPNLDEAVAEMEDHGIRLINRLTVGEMRVAIFHPEDTYGATIELIEY